MKAKAEEHPESNTWNHTPYTLHPAPYTLHPTPETGKVWLGAPDRIALKVKVWCSRADDLYL